MPLLLKRTHCCTSCFAYNWYCKQHKYENRFAHQYDAEIASQAGQYVILSKQLKCACPARCHLETINRPHFDVFEHWFDCWLEWLRPGGVGWPPQWDAACVLPAMWWQRAEVGLWARPITAQACLTLRSHWSREPCVTRGDRCGRVLAAIPVASQTLDSVHCPAPQLLRKVLYNAELM